MVELTFNFKGRITWRSKKAPATPRARASSIPRLPVLRDREPSGKGEDLAPTAATPLAAARDTWTHRRFFALLRDLGRLRVIHRSGASTFEALCTMGPHGFAEGHMNAITDAYHWHVRLDAFGYLRTQDTTHARSGRRVLFFELREREASAPFALVYLHREKGEEFEPDREQRFMEAHAQLSSGRVLAAEDDR